MIVLKKLAAGLNAACADFRDSLRADKPTFSITDQDTGYKLHTKTNDGHDAWINVEVCDPQHSVNLFSDLVRFGLRQKMNVIGAQIPQKGE